MKQLKDKIQYNMKKYLILCLLTIVSFVILTISTAKLGRHYDGNDFYGFPLTFHTKFSEVVSPVPTSKMDLTRTNYLFLVIDVLFAFLLSFSILRIVKYLKLRFQKNS